MKAALFYGGPDIRVETAPDPVPGPGEVLVRVRAAGVCGSDLHRYRRKDDHQTEPSMTGHELAGDIAAVGPGVMGLAVGQRVGVEPRHLVSCGHCRWCLRGDTELCPEVGMEDGRHVQSTGFAEYSLEPAENCYPLPDMLPYDTAAILDVYAVAVHALHRVPVGPMDTVVVFGAGAVGLAVVQVARTLGAGRVIAVDTWDAPLAAARQLGCDAVINSTEADVVAAVRDLTGGQGADVVFEAVGGRAPTFAAALDVVARGGRVGVIGMFSDVQTLDPRPLMRKELNLHWIWSYGLWCGVPEFQIALDMLVSGKIDTAPLITHRFPLDRIADAFAAADDKRASGAIKVLIQDA